MQAECLAPPTAHLIVVTVLSMICLPLRTGYADDIHGAAWEGNFPKFKAFVEADPSNIPARDGDRRTRLHSAARGSHPEMVRYLISNGADISAVAYNKFTPLHLTRNGEVARILIAAGADLHAFAASQTPLHHARLQII